MIERITWDIKFLDIESNLIEMRIKTEKNYSKLREES